MKKCSSAFNQLYLHSSGKVYPCSFLQNDERYELGSIEHETIEDIWLSEKVKTFRKMHLIGDTSSRCSHNQTNYLCEKLSDRPYYNDDLSLKRIDVMLDSFCNLVCIMCTNIYDDTGGFKTPFFWDNNDKLISSLIEVELVGGEPLVSPLFFKLAEKVFLQNNKCHWKVTTNANYPITKRLKETLSKLNFTHFTVSLDSLYKEVFEKIRHNGDFELVMKNIDKFESFMPEVTINTVVQTLNYNEIFEIYHWTKERNFRFYPILLTHPDTYSLLALPVESLKSITAGLIKKNKEEKSMEIFFLIKKILINSSLQRDIDIISSYQEHLNELGAWHG
jgi:radical SAM protein with 4Fe4S-binding SPASM domain